MLERGSRPGDLVEHPALVRRVAANGLDQIRNQVRTALELHVDVRPTGVGLVPQANEAVVAEHEDDPEDDNNTDDDPEPEHGFRV
jgi:hypothetical protein